MNQHEQLRKYNLWRRGDNQLKMPDPTELGELIDDVADRLEFLERDNQTLRCALMVVVSDWTEQFERNGHLAPFWVKQAREALAHNTNSAQRRG